MSRCVIVGAAPYETPELLASFIRNDDFIIAADGGLYLLQDMAKPPHLVIGDFDSSPLRRLSVPVITLPAHKDDTDVIAAIKWALRKGYREFLLLGCTGGRLDHTVANIFALRFLLEHDAEGILRDEHQEIRLLPPGQHRISHRKDQYLSLFPYGGTVSGLTLQNLEYPLQNAELDCVYPIGVSNEFTQEDAQIRFESGYLLVILTRSDHNL